MIGPPLSDCLPHGLKEGAGADDSDRKSGVLACRGLVAARQCAPGESSGRFLV